MYLSYLGNMILSIKKNKKYTLIPRKAVIDTIT